MNPIGFEIIECDAGILLNQQCRSRNGSNQATATHHIPLSSHLVVNYNRIIRKLKKLYQLDYYRIKLISKIANLGAPSDETQASIGPSIFNLPVVHSLLNKGKYLEKDVNIVETKLQNIIDELSRISNSRVDEIKEQSKVARHVEFVFNKSLREAVIDMSDECTNGYYEDTGNFDTSSRTNLIELISSLEHRLASKPVAEMYSVLDNTVLNLIARCQVDTRDMQKIREKVDQEMQGLGISLEHSSSLCNRHNLLDCIDLGKIEYNCEQRANEHFRNRLLELIVESCKHCEAVKWESIADEPIFHSLQTRWINHIRKPNLSTKSTSTMSKAAISEEEVDTTDKKSAQLSEQAIKLEKLRAKHKALLLRAIETCRPLCPYEIVLNHN